ncbi:FtsH protease activity modulator HflK [Vibrio parahaemolyticus]|nr:FtsH protease activity modulator HflK [Vibrio parahaemolyticus]
MVENIIHKVVAKATSSVIATIAVANIAVVGLMATVGSFYSVSESQSALVFRWGDYVETKGSGLNWNFPIIDRVELVDVKKIEEFQFADTYLTLDENVIETAFNVQFRVSDPYVYLVKAANPLEQLVSHAESAARAVVADFSMDDAITIARDSVKNAVEDKLNEILESKVDLGIEVVALNYVSGQPPRAVKAAFDDAITSREDAESFINDAQAYKEDVIPKAQGEANRLLNEARSYAEKVVNKAKGDVQRFEQLLPEFEKNKELTKSRIYIDTVSNVIQNNTVIINDGDSQNNIGPIQTIDVNKIVATTRATAK